MSASTDNQCPNVIVAVKQIEHSAVIEENVKFAVEVQSAPSDESAENTVPASGKTEIEVVNENIEKTETNECAKKNSGTESTKPELAESKEKESETELPKTEITKPEATETKKKNSETDSTKPELAESKEKESETELPKLESPKGEEKSSKTESTTRESTESKEKSIGLEKPVKSVEVKDLHLEVTLKRKELLNLAEKVIPAAKRAKVMV